MNRTVTKKTPPSLEGLSTAEILVRLARYYGYDPNEGRRVRYSRDHWPQAARHLHAFFGSGRGGEVKVRKVMNGDLSPAQGLADDLGERGHTDVADKVLRLALQVRNWGEARRLNGHQGEL
jgi:hypothetical protein